MMRCAKCGTENLAGQAVCASCGTRLAPPQPGAPGTYRAQPQSPRPQQTPSPPPAPARKKRPVWLVVAAIAGVLFLFAAACGVVALLFLLPTDKDTNGDTGTNNTQPKSERAGDGYNSPEKALDAEAKNLISGDWVFYTVDEQDDYVEYWVGPQNSQFEKGVIVTKTDKGKWVASDVYTLDLSQQASGGGGGASTGDESPGDTTTEGEPTDEEIAVYVVTEYLTAVSEGRGDDAYALTMPPLSDAGPDSMTGDFETFEIFGAEMQEDGGIWVTFTLKWPDETKDMGALVGMDADGVFYIADVSDLSAQ